MNHICPGLGCIVCSQSIQWLSSLPQPSHGIYSSPHCNCAIMHSCAKPCEHCWCSQVNKISGVHKSCCNCGMTRYDRHLQPQENKLPYGV